MEEIDLPVKPPKAQPHSKQAVVDGDWNVLEQLEIGEMPFRFRLSFAPLLEMIKKKAESNNVVESSVGQLVMSRLKDIPELWQPIEDRSILEKHQDVIELLMLMVVPPVLRRNQLIKVSAPFEMSPIYMTEALQEHVQAKNFKYVINHKPGYTFCSMVISACSFILNTYYGTNLNVDSPLSISISNPHTGMERHYKTRLETEYMELKKLKPLKPLSQDQINELLSNVYDLDLWLEYLPPENFEFRGFTIGTLIDITEEEALSRLKFALLERDAVVQEEQVERLESLVRNFLNIPNLQMGVTAIDYPKEQRVAHRYKIRYDFLADEQENLLADVNAGSIYEKACKYQEVVLVEDLDKVKNKTPIEEGLLKKGIRSIIVAPLLNKKEQVIGLLEIGSSKAFELHSFIELKFRELTSLFCMAVERSRDEIDNQIEAIIREQYTAIHPSVEWKFIETSYNLLEKRETEGKNAVAPSIAFRDVHPLYAQADIVSSSDKRNQAIQADLSDNLQLLLNILNKAIALARYPLLNQYRSSAEQNLSGILKDFNSNDESRIVSWLKDEIHPVLEDIRARYPELQRNISYYFDYIDADLGIVYKERKKYEDSVSLINSTIAHYLEEQQEAAQKIVPHYFERYKTDGVEYDIYVGQSLLKNGSFKPMHLRNLRLWQVIDMCEVTRLVHHLQAELPVPLTTAQLIFTYSNPLSIRFRMDEKQFDVDGAYNVRYEILKKRIDKALIEGTDERLTQAGKVAIVYLQEKDRQEYLEYASYLRTEGYITEEIEDLKIGKLQGVQGLRALRFTVKQ
ncbi:MAG: hypothetical protein RIC19_13180 [Phaeodactylibacter sp.]|uniref:hypothetical protein n=1 Tax=Phaeodactylibacter sp. TaxID=1940289 RepID=UPI0032EB46C7